MTILSPSIRKYGGVFTHSGLSLLLADASRLTDLFGYIWYVHAILTGAFVAYLPFSRKFHIIAAPVVLAINAVTQNPIKRD